MEEIKMTYDKITIELTPQYCIIRDTVVLTILFERKYTATTPILAIQKRII